MLQALGRCFFFFQFSAFAKCSLWQTQRYVNKFGVWQIVTRTGTCMYMMSTRKQLPISLKPGLLQHVMAAHFCRVPPLPVVGVLWGLMSVSHPSFFVLMLRLKGFLKKEKRNKEKSRLTDFLGSRRQHRNCSRSGSWAFATCLATRTNQSLRIGTEVEIKDGETL